ncbi:BQ5605_C020g09072 [Microbotryum silenes-dioicae]|uniref:BQ5605_C020g09072 protein n=1 Tax=Microbotryum silenes-dioicae TaxID=796604 RepID=A0A2X0MJP1_9BASI|nr:BQ5605_C020g09072 [Microbotryum silenes-dioicae]
MSIVSSTVNATVAFSPPNSCGDLQNDRSVQIAPASIELVPHNQHLKEYTFPSPSGGPQATRSEADLEQDQLRSPTPEPLQSPHRHPSPSTAMGGVVLSSEHVAAVSDKEKFAESDLPRFPQYDLTSEHPSRDLPDGLQQPRSMSFSGLTPILSHSPSLRQQEVPTPEQRGLPPLPPLSETRPSSRHEYSARDQHSGRDQGDHRSSTVGRSYPILGSNDYATPEPHPYTPRQYNLEGGTSGNHLRNLLLHNHSQSIPHPQQPAQVVYGSSITHESYTIPSMPHPAQQHPMGMYPGQQHQYQHGNGSGSSSAGMSPRTPTAHVALGAHHAMENEAPFYPSGYPQRQHSAEGSADGLDPSTMQYGGHPYFQQHPPPAYHDHGSDQHRPGFSGPMYYSDNAQHVHHQQHPSQQHPQHHQQHELRYLGPREDMNHGRDDGQTDHQEQGQQSSGGRSSRRPARRTMVRRAAAVRQSSNVYHPTPRSMLAPNAPSLPWSGIPGVAASAPPGKLAGIPTDDEFMQLPTKRSRGRRPPSSPELLFPSNPNIDPNEALIAYSGVTKTGKPRKIFLCKVPDCNKIFKRSEHLKRHVRSIHTEIKPFQCQWPGCAKLFSRHDNLNQHLRVHRAPGQSDASFSIQLEHFFGNREGQQDPHQSTSRGVASTSAVAGASAGSGSGSSTAALNLPPLQGSSPTLRHHHHQQQQVQQSDHRQEYDQGGHHSGDEYDLDENGAPIPRGARESTAGSLETEGSLYAPSR